MKIWHLTSSGGLQLLVVGWKISLLEGEVGRVQKRLKHMTQNGGGWAVDEMLTRSAAGACGRRGISVPKEKERQVMVLKGKQSCGDSFPAAVMH